MNKPDACQGCPLYGDGEGYVADEICEGATYLLVLDSPNKDAINAGRPLAGDLGNEYEEKYFARAEAIRGRNPMLIYDYFTEHEWCGEPIPTWSVDNGNISIAHVLRCDARRLTVNERSAIEHCRQFDVIQDAVKLVIASGNLAWETLTEETGKVITWRGSISKRE